MAMFCARAFNESRRPFTARGVKPREMMERIRVCCGASMLSRITRCISMSSRVMSSPNRMIAEFS